MCETENLKAVPKFKKKKNEFSKINLIFNEKFKEKLLAMGSKYAAGH